MICITLRNFTEVSDMAKIFSLGSVKSSLLQLALESIYHKHATFEI